MKYKEFRHKLKEVADSKVDLFLETDKQYILKQDKEDYERGLLVKLNEEGSYLVNYWAGKPEPYPIEVVIDGKSVKKDAVDILLKFHPKNPEVE